MSRPRRAAAATAIALLALLGSAAPGRGDGPGEPDGRLRIHHLHSTDGQGRWQPQPRFHLEWDQPDAEAQALIRGIGYRVEDASGEVVVPTVHVDRRGHSLGPITVPALPGVYRAWVWLEGELADGPAEAVILRFDDVAPASVQPLPSTGWIKAGTDASIGFEHPAAPWPLAGIRGYAVTVDQSPGGRPCQQPDRCTEAETDLSGGAEDDGFALGQLAEGVSIVHVLAVSASGMSSTTVGAAAVRVDGTPPEVGFAPVPDRWSDRPLQVRALATDELSGMAPAASGAVTALTVDGGAALVSPGDLATATVHGDGVHLVTAAARDAAGNATWERGGGTPPAVVVRIDEAPPRVAFAPSQDPAEPERLEARVTDSLSGPAAQGWIGVRPAGDSRPYAPLPTSATGGRLVAIWDSDDSPAGEYEFRAVAFDAAGNRASGERREGGAAMTLASPLKPPTTLQVGFGGERLTAQSCRRVHGRVRCRRRQIRSLDRRPSLARARYGRETPVAGRLSTQAGAPLAGLPVSVSEEFDPGAGLQTRTTTIQTGAGGRFLVHLAPGPSRRIQVWFGGDRVLGRAAGRPLRLRVHPAVRLHASARTALVGGAPVLFSGSVAPAPGAPVELQFRLPGGRWSQFRSVATDSQGRFRYPYAFSDDDSRGVGFQFRAVVPPRPGWPYAEGASLPVTVAGR